MKFEIFFHKLLLLVFSGALLGAVFSSGSTNELTMRFLLSSLAIGLTGTQSAITIFGGKEKVIFLRESASGIKVTAYFWGKLVSYLVRILTAPAFFLLLYYPLSAPRFSFFVYYQILLWTNLTAMSIGVLISLLFSRNSAFFAGVIVSLISILFSGMQPPVKELETTIFGQIGMSLSYARWTTEAQFFMELSAYPPSAYKLNVVSGIINFLGYGQNHTLNLETVYELCIVQLLYITVACLLISYIILLRNAR